MEKIVREFMIEKETPGTYRYKELFRGNPIAVDTLYLKKEILGDNPPEKIKVTIEQVE